MTFKLKRYKIQKDLYIIMPRSKKWILSEAISEHSSDSAAVAAELGICGVLADILVRRGYTTPDEARAFLGKETTLFHDPFLMNDMELAVERILRACSSGEHITVYGDYDVDGVTSVSTLKLYLTAIGATVDCYIPNRAGEGYGVNSAALDKLAAGGTSLIITVDTGITAIEEAKHIKELGMELIVTDHHLCQDELPDAVAVIDPHRHDNTYPYTELAGVGVVFKLLCAIEKRRLELEGEQDAGRYLYNICRDYCDLVAIGTIADVMPLRDENRLICAIGLSSIERAPRLGLAALMEQASEQKNQRYPKKRRITASYISFTIAPKVNAAGRLGDAMEGVRLFLSDSKAEATRLASALCALNTQRQAEENRIALEAIELAESTHDFEHDPVLVLANEGWHHGVIGIVASRLTERYNMPTLLVSIEDGIGKGSGRSIKGLDLTEALSACSDKLIRYGGHELAAGFTVAADKIDDFRRAINAHARERMDTEASEPVLEIDRTVSEGELTLDMAEQLTMLEPCGVDNPHPLLLLKNAQIADISAIGNGGKHTKLTLRGEGEGKTALLFGVSPAETDFAVGDTVDIVFQADINEFQNVRSLQLLVKDMRLCEAELCLYRKEMELYRAVVLRGERFEEHDRLLPDRGDFTMVYTALKKLAAEGDVFGLHKLSRRVQSLYPDRLPPLRMSKIRICLLIFADVGLISMENIPDGALSGTELYRIRICQVSGKVNLEGAPRYKLLKKQLKRSRERQAEEGGAV